MASQENIRSALERAAATISLKPSVGQRLYKSTAVVENGLACRITEKNHVLIADLSPSMGGEGSGPSPSALLRAALSSCVAIGVKMWAARKSVAIDRVEVQVETGVDARGQFGVSQDISPGFEGVRINIRIDSAAGQKLLAEIVATSLRFSPLMDAFCNAQAVETHLTFDQRVPGDQ